MAATGPPIPITVTYNNSGQLKGGTILDRDGDMLSTLDENGNRIYYRDATVRRATLHA